MAEKGTGELMIGITELKMQFKSLTEEIRALRLGGSETRESVEGLRRDMNGRFKKLEHTVFGNEEDSKIGLAEKVRRFDDVNMQIIGDEREGVLSLPERVRNLESGWAKLTTLAVLASTVAIEGLKFSGHWIYTALTSGKLHN